MGRQMCIRDSHITAAGVLYRDRLEQEWNEFQERVCIFLKEQKDE